MRYKVRVYPNALVSLRALTRNLILTIPHATRCVPTGLTGWDAGSSPAGHGESMMPCIYTDEEFTHELAYSEASGNATPQEVNTFLDRWRVIVHLTTAE